MKISLNWLKKYVEVPWNAAELADRLTMLGVEVEGVQTLTAEFEGIVVAEVLTRDKHPNADKLSLCRVRDGAGERQIVCGAQNFKAGDKVPLILPGSALPPKPGEKEPFVIKIGKIRGVESQGMMCSPQELGLPNAVDGLLILKGNAVVGQSFAEYLGRSGGDVIYDLEITPNRPDLNSHLGIAREIAALTGGSLRMPSTALPPAAEDRVENRVAVRLDAPELCPRYTARVIRGVKVGPSPEWLRVALERVGLRSINNVVDVTNYVLMEMGHPLHAFDLRLVGNDSSGQATVVVRRAGEGEAFVTLDGQRRVLDAEMVVIADSHRAIALAGVMGGLNSEIQADTRDVLIESAWFLPSAIRRASKRLGLRTDASYRFERSADLEACDEASRRCAQLILETAGGVLLEGCVDARHGRSEVKRIGLRPQRVAQVLGVEIPESEVQESLVRLGLKPVGGSGGLRELEVPSWRVDLKEEIDLIEEVVRLHGVDRIPATPPRGAVGDNPFDARFDELDEARRLLTGLGLHEAQGQTLIASESASYCVEETRRVGLAHPLSSDMDALRPSLLPGLLDSLKHNQSRRESDVRLFEIGRVFVGGTAGVQEERRVAMVLSGLRERGFWQGSGRDETLDVFDLKGVVEEFLEGLGVKGVVLTKRAEAAGLWAESAALALGGKLPVGELGQLSPQAARRWDLKGAIFLAEMNLDLLLARRQQGRSFKPLPLFPGIRRDAALVVAESITHEAIVAAIKQAKPAHLESVEIFDVFRGRGIPEDHKSLVYALRYRHAERTLTDAEVNEAHEKVLAKLKEAVQAVIRA